MANEVEDMPPRLGLIFQPGAGRPILHRRIRYFEDRVFRARAAAGWVVPPVQFMDGYQSYVRRQGGRVLSEDEIASIPLDRVVIGRASAVAFASIIAAAKASQASRSPSTAEDGREPAASSSGEGGASMAQSQRRTSRFTGAIEAARQRVA
jgi:hypothetical protein